MIRRARLSLVVLGTGLAALGCSQGEQSVPTAKEAAKPSPTPIVKLLAPPKLFENWPTPTGVLVITGQQIGYVEPCGCAAGQIGGLARRLDLMQQLRKKGWPLVPIDLGSLANDPNTMGGPEESRIRFSFSLQALGLQGYDALALSPSDLRLGVGEVMIRLLNHQGDKLHVVSANVKPDPALGLEKRFVPYVNVPAGDMKIGITAVIAKERWDELKDPDKTAMLGFQEPEKVLPGVFAKLEKDTQVQVLLVQGPVEYARQLAEAYPGFDVVVATSTFVAPPKEPELLNGGKTQLITVGLKGQYVGALGLFEGEKPPFRYQRVELGSDFDNKTEAMRKLIDEDFQVELKQAGLLESYPRHAYVFGDRPSDAQFVGSDVCGKCHVKTYIHWTKTKHAHAYAVLTDPKRNREFDPHCVDCHTLGFEIKGGFISAAKTPQFENVHCENCHGPGSKHVSDPDNKDFQAQLHRDAVEADKTQSCVKCHSEDDSPHFNFEKYWPDVKHTGLDKLTDPKYHKGLDLSKSAQSAPGN